MGDAEKPIRRRFLRARLMCNRFGMLHLGKNLTDTALAEIYVKMNLAGRRRNRFTELRTILRALLASCTKTQRQGEKCSI
jgi:hypothetical protein